MTRQVGNERTGQHPVTSTVPSGLSLTGLIFYFPTRPQVKPLLSVDRNEARQRVLSLYKAWHRQIPFMMRDYELPITEKQAYAQLRKKFNEHKNVKDTRVIDMLVVQVRLPTFSMPFSALI